MTPQTVLKEIGDYNVLHNTKLKPAIYYDDLNQAFSWKKVIEPVFAERIKEVFKMEQDVYLNKLSRRKEKLDSDIIQAEGLLKMEQEKKERIQKEMEENPNKDKIKRLYALKEEEKQLLKNKKELSPENKKMLEILERHYGDVLNTYMEDISYAFKSIPIRKAKIEKMKEMRENVLTQAKEFFNSMRAVKEVGPADLQKAQTGSEETIEEDYMDLISEKKA